MTKLQHLWADLQRGRPISKEDVLWIRYQRKPTVLRAMTRRGYHLLSDRMTFARLDDCESKP